MALISYFPYLSVNPRWAAIVVIGIITFIHTRNLKISALFQNSSTVIKMVLILFLIVMGAFLPGITSGTNTTDASYLTELISPAFAIALIYVVYSYSGWNAAAYITNEFENPSKSLPIVLIGGTVIVTILYSLLQYIFLKHLTLGEMEGQLNVAALAAQKMFGKAVGNLFGLAISISLISSVSAMVWVGARITASMANDHSFLFSFRMQSNQLPVKALWLQFVISSVPSLTSIVFTARTGGIVAPGTPIIYALSNSSVIHRSFDGGVLVSTKTPTFGASTVRVSKKYFRYQSGKGLLWSTGTLFRPNYDIQVLTASGTAIGSTVTLKVDDVDHGLQIGATITVSGVATSGYNGTYVVTNIIDDYTFTFLATQLLGATTAIMQQTSSISVDDWHGAVVRAGTFDDQNGMFWEYSGSILSVVRRKAVQQLSGTVAINIGSNTVTGTSTRFTQQVQVGDKIVIRGMTQYVTQVSSNTSMTVTPDYRAVVNASGVKATVVQETRIPQSEFNIDKIDGTGPSGYNINLSKMQMMGLQYTWYGAGFIDYMVRGADGNWVYAHRLKNNNVNTEAHMRTGNLPVRYSVDNDGSPALCYLTANITDSDTTIPVNSTAFFPALAGTLYIDNELINYATKTSTSFLGCTRAITLNQYVSGSYRTATAGAAAAHTAGTGIIMASNTCSPTLSHWGSALICDGLFDTDRGYIFNYQRSAVSISTTTVTMFLIRLAPSVSNSQIGDLGVKDLLNRSQLLLNSVAVQTYNQASSPGSVIVEGVLNPKNFTSAVWSSLNLESQGGQPSFAQVATTVVWSSGTFAVPGEQVFAFAATPGSNNDLSLVELKELTNSPFGGVGGYPNGPDILAVNVKMVSGTATATTLLRWGEAQA
jgi:hypothetical protein